MTARRLGASCWAVCAAAALGTLVLLALDAGRSTPADGTFAAGPSGLTIGLASLAFATVGAMVAARAPANAIGWIFCATGLSMGVGALAVQYANRMLFIASDPLPGGAIAAWIQNFALAPSFGLLGLALMLFPDGRLPSRRWRPVLWLALAGIGLTAASGALAPGPLVEPFATVVNPVGIAGAGGVTDVCAGAGFLAMLTSVGCAGLAMVIRLRRSHGTERQQLKWIAFAAALSAAVVVGDIVGYFFGIGGSALSGALLGLAFAVFPVAAGAAILRYRLYDIDVVINRTLVYAALTATLAGAYLASVLLLQLMLNGLTGDSGLAVAGSTLAVAALFRPARARIQGLVDRRFYRRRYDAQRTLASFSGRLRDEVDLAALTTDLRAVVRDTMQPAHVSLWLRPDGGRPASAPFPEPERARP
jgi:hypothetical protein